MSTHYRRAAPPSSIILFASIKSQGKVRERSRKGSEWSRNGSGEAAERRRRGGGSLLEQGSGESPPPCSAAGTTGSPKRKANFAKPSSAWKAVAPPQGKAGFQALKTVPFFSPSSHGQLAKLSNALAATCCAVQLPAPIVIGNKKMASKIFSSPFCSLLSSYSSSPSSPSSPFPISPRPSNIGQNSTAPSAAAAAPSPALPAATSSPNPDAATARCRRHAVAAASPRSSPLPANVAAAAAASPPAASAAASCRQCNFNTRQ